MLDKAGADIKELGVFAKMAAKLQTAMKMAANSAVTVQRQDI
jgi:hypothetical protein